MISVLHKWEVILVLYNGEVIPMLLKWEQNSVYKS